MKVTILLFSLLASPLWAGDFVFKKELIEVTANPDDDKVNVDFDFKVEGEGVATVKRYEAQCSCLEAQLSKGGKLVWESGETGSVRGIFSVGNFRGTLDKSITLQMADGKRHMLTVRMTMPELLVIEPKTLRWDENVEPEAKYFTIKVNHDEPIHITGLSGTNDEKFPHQLEVVEDGKAYRIKVEAKDVAKRGFGLLRISTDCKFKKHQSYQCFMVVTKPEEHGGEHAKAD